MRIATYRRKDTPQAPREVGLVADDGATIVPLGLSAEDAKRGAFGLIEAMANGAPAPTSDAAPIAIGSVTLEAPVPEAVTFAPGQFADARRFEQAQLTSGYPAPGHHGVDEAHRGGCQLADHDRHGESQQVAHFPADAGGTGEGGGGSVHVQMSKKRAQDGGFYALTQRSGKNLC